MLRLPLVAYVENINAARSSKSMNMKILTGKMKATSA
jgi:hypothetical protein